MATVQEILKKPNRKKFTPQTRRAWNFEIEDTKRNPKQYRNNIGTDKETNKEQYRNNIGTNENINTINWEQNRNKSQNINGNNLYKDVAHDNYKLASADLKQPLLTNSYILKKLKLTSGLQNQIMRHIISHIKNQPNKSYEVDISIEVLSKNINTDKDTTRVSIKRLRKKNLLIGLDGEKGRHGSTKVRVPNFVVEECFNLFSDAPYNINEYRNKNESAVNSSSSNYINTTTTREEEKIDIEPIQFIGFTKSHLQQIIDTKKLDVKTIQNSIYAFAFDLKENNKIKSIKGDAVNFFMGILRNGKPYIPPSNYESPEDKAMRIYLERMRDIEQKRIATEKEAFNISFNEWFLSISDEQKRELLPEFFRRNLNSNTNLEKNKMLESSARTYFEKEIWASKKIEIILEK